MWDCSFNLSAPPGVESDKRYSTYRSLQYLQSQDMLVQIVYMTSLEFHKQ